MDVELRVNCSNKSENSLEAFQRSRLGGLDYTIEIIDIECVLGHESCLHFFSQVPF